MVVLLDECSLESPLGEVLVEFDDDECSVVVAGATTTAGASTTTGGAGATTTAGAGATTTAGAGSEVVVWLVELVVSVV